MRFARQFLLLIAAVACCLPAVAQNELRFSLKADPKSFNPLLVEDEPSLDVRYLTGGVLVRVNRKTQQVEPELAQSWQVSKDGKQVTFKLRPGAKFSDGSPVTAADAIATLNALFDPKLHSTTGDSFRTGKGDAKATSPTANTVVVTFPAAVSGVMRLFDQVPIAPAAKANAADESVTAGAFTVADYKPGQYVLLKRNPNYWKKDASGHALPYLDSIRLDIQTNLDAELLRFSRGEIQLINSVTPDLFDRMQQSNSAAARDLGPSLDSEQMWFNQVASAPLPDYKKAWFRSRNFRLAISHAINREDMARVVFRGHARPSAGPVTPANKFWFNPKIAPHSHDTKLALSLLHQDGFRLEGGKLKDRAGNPVVFSLITNAGNKARERMAALIQQDLAQIGVTLHLVPLDFPSLIQRITSSFDYEACLLGLTNVDLDPASQMNVWLSSGDNHQWNPSQTKPATEWEAEIDRLMNQQASTTDQKARKAAFDRVQQIVSDQAPFLYLVDKDALVAVSPKLKNADPVVLQPQTFWNAEYLSLK